MLTRLLLAAALALLVRVAPAARADDEAKAKAPAATEAKAKAAEIPWAKTYAEAVERARKEQKLVMVDVYTDWCVWCKKLDADTYPDPAVVKAAGPYVGVKIDAEDKKEGTEVATKFKVDGFPTILILDPQAEGGPKVESRIGGYMPPGPFAAKLGTIDQDHRDFPKLKERLAAAPDDLDALGKLTVIYSSRQEPELAGDLLKRGLKADPENSKGSLTKALNAVADAHQGQQEFAAAIPLFRKAAATAKDPADAAYARSSIAMCLLPQGKVEEALVELEAVAKMDDAPKEDKANAVALIKRIKDVLKRAKQGKDQDKADAEAKDKAEDQ